MTPFAILVKSHGPDLPYVERLLSSFERFNADGVHLYLVVPPTDLASFERFANLRITVMSESVLADHLTTEPVNGYEPGYINQEIVKLAFWETGLASNYLCMDSDGEFVREFYVSDFMADDNTPFTFLSEDAELRAEPEYYRTHWQGREPMLRRIQLEVGLEERRLLTVHGHAVFSATVLRAFRDRFLAPRHWDYIDAIAVSPFEPTWYSMWLQKDQTIPIIMREPIIKTIHASRQQLDYALRGLHNDDVARGYVAVVINSNYSRGAGLASLSDSPETVLSSFVPPAELARAAGYGLARPARRLMRSRQP